MGGEQANQNHRHVYVPFHLNPKYSLFFVLVWFFLSLFHGPKVAFQVTQNYHLHKPPCARETISHGHCLPWCVLEKLLKQVATGLQNVHRIFFFFFLPHAEIVKTNNNPVSFANCISLG